MEFTIIIPEKGKLKETAKVLIDLADNITDVMTDGNGTEFRVPPYLADKYARVAYQPTTPKRRGRPPKIKEEVNDNGDNLF